MGVHRPLRVANWEIVLWSLGSLGGAVSLIDVEDVFLRCFDLAPTRFSWRTRATIPDAKKCHKALQEAESREPRLLVKTPDGYRRQLTVEGQSWLEFNTPRLVQILGPDPDPRELDTRQAQRLLDAAESASVFRVWMETGNIETERWRLAELFRCLPDSSVEVWHLRLQTLRSAAHAGHRSSLLDFLAEVEQGVPSLFLVGLERGGPR